MQWNELTESEKRNFLDVELEELATNKEMTANEIIEFVVAIPKNLYYIEDGLTYQF